MIIKVCGMKEPENILRLADLKPDYMGFIFYTQSRRYAGVPDKDTLASLPSSIMKTGVFVDESIRNILEKVINYNLDAVQLHGAESAEFCLLLRKELDHVQAKKHIEIIKAFGLSPGFSFRELEPFATVSDFFLFDTKTAEHGGSGIVFDWKMLEQYIMDKPYFLSGGLSPENIAGISDFKDTNLYGVDLNSRFEIEPGIKDIQKLESAFQIIRKKAPIRAIDNI